MKTPKIFARPRSQIWPKSSKIWSLAKKTLSVTQTLVLAMGRITLDVVRGYGLNANPPPGHIARFGHSLADNKD